MARQTNVVEARLRLYNRDQVPSSETLQPPSYIPFLPLPATPTAITISVATDATTTPIRRSRILGATTYSKETKRKCSKRMGGPRRARGRGGWREDDWNPRS